MTHDGNLSTRLGTLPDRAGDDPLHPPNGLTVRGDDPCAPRMARPPLRVNLGSHPMTHDGTWSR